MCRGLVEISSGDDAFDLPATSIKTLIHRHQRIIALSADIETLFSYIALMQFLWNTLVICCLGFLIVTVSNVMHAMLHIQKDRNQFANHFATYYILCTIVGKESQVYIGDPSLDVCMTKYYKISREIFAINKLTPRGMLYKAFHVCYSERDVYIHYLERCCSRSATHKGDRRC